MIYHLIFRDVNVQYLNVCWHCCRCDEELYRRLGFHDRTGLQIDNPKSRTPRVQMKYTLANSALGAIITHALVTEDGGITVAAESGDVLYWNMEERTVIFQVRKF